MDATLKQAKRREMILSGNIWKTLLVIITPLAVYQFFNSSYTLLDQIICAGISTTAQNAVSSISQIKNAISAFGAGLAAGGAVIVSRYYGAGEVKHARHASSNLLVMTLILSAILMILLIPLAEPILRLCQIAPDSIKIGVSYFQLQMLELAFICVNNVFIGLEKAKGNSKMIFLLNIVVLLIKLAFMCLFIYGIGGSYKDIKFVEISTIIAQGTLTLIGVFFMFRRANIIRLSPKMFILRKMYVAPILILSIPIFLGKFVMSLGKVVVNGMCGAYWNTATDGLIVGTLGVSNNMCGMITSPTNSFEEGESTIVSQNLGNKNMKRTIKVFWRTLLSVTIVSILGWLTMLLLKDQIVELFSSSKSSDSPERVAQYKRMIREIFVWDSLSIPTLGVTAAVLGLLYGYGQTGLSTILNLSRIGSRIVFLFIIHQAAPNLKPTLCAGLSMGISNTIILVVSVGFLVFFLLKIRKRGYKGMHFSDPEPGVSALKLDDDATVYDDRKHDVAIAAGVVSSIDGMEGEAIELSSDDASKLAINNKERTTKDLDSFELDEHSAHDDIALGCDDRGKGDTHIDNM